jgi:hypothetical protein
MRLYQIEFYSAEGEKKMEELFRVIDITTNQTILQNWNSGKTERLNIELKSFNIVNGVITVYYLDNSYIIITKRV